MGGGVLPGPLRPSPTFPSVFVIWHKELLCFLWLGSCWGALLAAAMGWRREEALSDLPFLVTMMLSTLAALST